MAGEDFDIDSLAAYLHVMPAQISRLADRGKIPGRRVGGEWRFSQAEIHHWLEQRIGLSDADELMAMEGVLKRSAGPATEEVFRISDLILPEAIAVPLDARTRASVISAMTELAANTSLLWDPSRLAEAVEAREQMHPTALDNGAALLHPRRPMPTILAEAVVAVGVKPGGVPFGGRSLTDVFFLLCSTTDHEHLRILARLSRLIAVGEFLADLRGAADSQEVLEIIRKREDELR
jgi:PTS system nitrogen regulatory IIA component